MAQFMKFGPLTADDIESGNANDGDVLTADGNGGSAFAASDGCGEWRGFSIEVIFTVSDGYINIVLKSAGVAVTQAAFFLYVTSSGSPIPTNDVTLGDSSGGYITITLQPLVDYDQQNMLYLAIYDSADPRLSTSFSDLAGVYYLNVVMPSGALVSSVAL